jgi:hypothetical protein
MIKFAMNYDAKSMYTMKSGLKYQLVSSFGCIFSAVESTAMNINDSHPSFVTITKHERRDFKMLSKFKFCSFHDPP